jgi:hypothetical protein
MLSNRNIEISNIPELDAFEEEKVKTALKKSFDRLKAIVHNELTLHVHFKQHEVEGQKAKHSVHLKLSFPGKTIVASEFGWLLPGVVQKSLEALERETFKALKKD